jgi:hypothetical protein
MVATNAPRSKTEVRWDQIVRGHVPQPPTLPPFRKALAALVATAKQALPSCNGRVDTAVQIRLAGDGVPAGLKGLHRFLPPAVPRVLCCARARRAPSQRSATACPHGGVA